jgi:hypothetical protein
MGDTSFDVEYWAADAGGPRAEQAGKVEARLLLSRSEGGTVARAGGNTCGPLSARLDRHHRPTTALPDGDHYDRTGRPHDHAQGAPLRLNRRHRSACGDAPISTACWTAASGAKRTSDSDCLQSRFMRLPHAGPAARASRRTLYVTSELRFRTRVLRRASRGASRPLVALESCSPSRACRSLDAWVA